MQRAKRAAQSGTQSRALAGRAVPKCHVFVVKHSVESKQGENEVCWVDMLGVAYNVPYIAHGSSWVYCVACYLTMPLVPTALSGPAGLTTGVQTRWKASKEKRWNLNLYFLYRVPQLAVQRTAAGRTASQ